MNHCIGPDGPDHADYLFVGEAPGAKENAGRPPTIFIGPTGQEVNQHYLPLAGLQRGRNVVFTNAIWCLPDSAGGKLDATKPKDLALLESCTATNLYPLIERLRPKVIIPLGALACRAVLPEWELGLELGHGIPADSPFGFKTFPMYHPALGIYEPKKMLHIRNDWIRLGHYLRGTLQTPVDEFEGVEDYHEVTDASELAEIDPSAPMGCDTESTRGGDPYCLTLSQQPGSGLLIRASRPDLLERFQQSLDEHRGVILFHNWFYDWAVTEAMGLVFPTRQVVDTMARVFHLGNLPQGLKALSRRELGMDMQDFDDLVTPYSSANVLHYYSIARATDFPKPEERMEIDDKTGLWKLKKPQGMNTKLKRFFTDYGKAPNTKDVFIMWEKNWVAEQAMIEAECGPYPGKCISHVPFQKVLHYACRDADALIRLWPLLKRMRANVRRLPQHNWRAA